MPAFIDYSGRRIGRVNILELHENRARSKWKCLCDCGQNFVCWSASFKRGDRFECEICRHERKRGIDLTGRKFGRWTVLRRVIDENSKTKWECRCDCGVMGSVASNNLGKKGRSESCGCLGRKKKSKWANTTLYPPSHKLATSRFYTSRVNLIHKCYKQKHPSYKNFGAKGFTFCDLWRNSAKDMHDWALVNGWEEKDVIVLKDGCREFNPSNCIILKPDEFRSQVSLKGGVQVTYNGETHSISKWAELMDVCVESLRNKLINNPSVESVFESTFKKFRFYHAPKEVDKIIELYNSGKTQVQIGRIMNTKPQNVRYYLVKNNIELRNEDRKMEKRSDIDTFKILELRAKGYSMLSISQKLNCSWPTIKNRLDKLNGKKRNRTRG